MDEGILPNGIRYFVKKNKHPKDVVELALGIKVGSVVEEYDESGVAHLIEHLQLCKKYKQTSKVLKERGVGTCQNGFTEQELTALYLNAVAKDSLTEAVKVLASFTKFDVSLEDFDREKQIVIQELNLLKNNVERRQLSDISGFLFKGTEYAPHNPEGLEHIVRDISIEKAKIFFEKWYCPSRMCVVVVGDFNTMNVVRLVKEHFAAIPTFGSISKIVKYNVPLHQDVRYYSFGDADVEQDEIWLVYKMPRICNSEHKAMMVRKIFLACLEWRFERVSNPINFKYKVNYSSYPIDVLYLTVHCKYKEHSNALTYILTELSRIRLHGFDENEVCPVIYMLHQHLKSKENNELEEPSNELRDTFIEHFQKDEALEKVGESMYETLLDITIEEVSSFAQMLKTTCSCSIIATSRVKQSVSALITAVDRVNLLEESENIKPWVEPEILYKPLLPIEPQPGDVLQDNFFEESGVHDLFLTNGIRISYKQADTKESQTTFRGFAYGGLSEVHASQYFSCSLSFPIGEICGLFGQKHEDFQERIKGRHASVGIYQDMYQRGFHGGGISQDDFETALQMVYLLFSSNKTLSQEKLESLLNNHVCEGNMRKAIAANLDNFLYGDNVRHPKYEDVMAVDLEVACKHLNDSFKDPSTFHVLIVSYLKYEVVLPMIKKYLGGIEMSSMHVMCFSPDNLKDVTVQVPFTSRREIFRFPMKSESGRVDVIYPFMSKIKSWGQDSEFIAAARSVLQSRLLTLMRTGCGNVYALEVQQMRFPGKPLSKEIRGYLIVTFSCFPECNDTLVDIVVSEVKHLRSNGFTEMEIEDICTSQQKSRAMRFKSQDSWINFLTEFYQGSSSQDLDEAYGIQLHRGGYLDQQSVMMALGRLFPTDDNYMLHIVMPDC